MIDLALRGEVAVLTLPHGKANAMDGTFCRDLVARLDELRASPARAVVITGEGKIFSAGVDLVQALDGGPDYFRRFLPPLRRAFEEIFFYEKPIVAAINGYAMGAGAAFGLLCDVIIIERGVRIADGHVRAAIAAGDGGGFGGGHTDVTLRLTPPIHPRAASLEIALLGKSGRATATVRLAWQTAP